MGFSDYTIPKEKIKELHQTKNDSIHIISAGPSLKSFSWKNLRDKDVMTINDSLFHMPLKAMYHIYNEPVEKWEKNYKAALKYQHLHRFSTFYYKGWHRINKYKGNNLAYILAIQLSVDLGYKNIFLYGYDFDVRDGYIHWWDKKKETDNYIYESKRDFVKKQKIKFDEFIYDLVEETGIKIYNINLIKINSGL